MTQAESNHETLKNGILTLLSEIKIKVIAHGQMDKINYGHVGDMNLVLEELQGIKSFLTK